MDWSYLSRWEFLLISLPILLLAIWELVSVRREIRRARANLAEVAANEAAREATRRQTGAPPLPPRPPAGNRAQDSAWRRPGS